MFSRQKANENVAPLGQRGVAAKKGHATNGQEVPVKGEKSKMTRAGVGQNKRAAFGDLTNATKKNTVHEGKKKLVTKTTVKANGIPIPVKSSKTKAGKKTVYKDGGSRQQTVDHSGPSTSSDFVTSSQESIPDSQSEDLNLSDADMNDVKAEEVESPQTEPMPFTGELVEFDKENFNDVNSVGCYVQDIFEYYKRRERMFPIPPYMSNGRHQINPGMRSILVDWMVEVQENFELNHETLYLAVKLTDLYLSIVNVKKDALQLVGAAAIFIAAKFDERFPPLIEDFTYVCDNAFDRQEFLEMEMELLRRIGFDIGIPISYRFLRRYARIIKLSMKTLTLARYILELSLMEYDLIVERDSRIAAAALIIAMRMMEEGEWEGDVVRSSGYNWNSLKDLVVKLNDMLLGPPVDQLATIRGKYSHKIFHEVAKIPILPTDTFLS